MANDQRRHGRFALVGALNKAGIQDPHAKPLASAIVAEIEDTVDTKLVKFRHELRDDFRNDMREQTKELRSEIGSVRRWRIATAIAGAAALVAFLALVFDAMKWLAGS